MSRPPRHDILFEPIEVGGVTFKNRFVGVAYSAGFGQTKPLAHAAHRRVQAEGGWAAIYTGVHSPSEDFEVDPHVDPLWSEGDIPRLRLIVNEIKSEGALAGAEIGHAGGDAYNRNSRWPAVAPSQFTSWRRPTVTSKAMELSDIRRIQADTVRSAVRARDAGYDLVCIYGGFSYLPSQFLSPFFNQRHDEYGGSLVNRARFWLETLEQVYDAVGNDVCLSARIPAAGLDEKGIGPEETLEFIRMADPYVHLWDVMLGALWANDTNASRFFPEGAAEEWIGLVRQATDKPIIGVGRYTNPDRMATALRTGIFDFVGAARPRIADPFLPAKIERGDLEDLRECTGANYCGATYHYGQMACIQNPTIGEEFRRGWHPERATPAPEEQPAVLVIGAGPAGMECAVTLAKRGFESVHLVDAASEVGGLLRWVPRLPGLAEWGRVVDYRKIQLDKNKSRVEVILNNRLSTQDVLDYGAEVVIVATGSTWADDGRSGDTHRPIAGADGSLPYVLTPEQIVDGKRPAGNQIVVYDTDGDYVAPALAVKLKQEGYDVHFVTSHAVVSPYSDERNDAPFLRQQLAELGITTRVSTQVTEIRNGEVDLTCPHIGGSGPLAVDGIVLVTQRVSDDRLYLNLVSDPERLQEAGIKGAYRIGDCVAPRDIGECVFDGHRIAEELESPDPSVPNPVRREIPLVAR